MYIYIFIYVCVCACRYTYIYIYMSGERVWSPQNVIRGLVKRAQLLWNVHNISEACTTSLKSAHLEYLKTLGGGGETRYTHVYIYIYGSITWHCWDHHPIYGGRGCCDGWEHLCYPNFLMTTSKKLDHDTCQQPVFFDVFCLFSTFFYYFPVLLKI